VCGVGGPGRSWVVLLCVADDAGCHVALKVLHKSCVIAAKL
jgi:hypothetical protein